MLLAHVSPGPPAAGSALSRLVASASVLPPTAPSRTGLPWTSKFTQLVDGLELWVLVIALVGCLIGAAVWAIGSHSQNLHQSVAGRRAVMVSGLAALIIGAAPALINWLYGVGNSLNGSVK